MSDQRYCFVRDEDCHNYLIPVELKERFKFLLDSGEDDWWATFNDEFEQYRIDSMTYWTFTDPKGG